MRHSEDTFNLTNLSFTEKNLKIHFHKLSNFHSPFLDGNNEVNSLILL